MEPKKSKPGASLLRIALLIAIPVAVFFTFSTMLNGGFSAKSKKEVYSDYIQYFIDNKVEEFTLDLGTGKMEMTLRPEYRSDKNEDGKIDEKDYVIAYTVPNVGHFVDVLDPILDEVANDDNPDNDVKYDFKPISDTSWITTWLPIVLMA